MYIPTTLDEENVYSNCLIDLIFPTSWRVGPKKRKFLIGIWIFGILYPKVSDPPLGLFEQNFGVFRKFF